MRALVLFTVAACTTTPKPRPVDLHEVEDELRAFLHHFENLEWDPFIASFAPDACVFHPSAKAPLEVCQTHGDAASATAFADRWRRVFDDTRAHATGGPPYMLLQPEELHVAALGDDTALATFVLRNDDRLARRSVVFVRIEGVWHIAHIHASNVPWPDP